ncbi:MAG TPA: outer membrane beta-barrel protein [bacterium]|nr:outer membrane beta-barrel protein [bacterium]HPJ71206.1 outer membrane beta-barrel protein [bacterium]HPQ65389.1 outer membrane beta-barrel protein [bacterium]
MRAQTVLKSTVLAAALAAPGAVTAQVIEEDTFFTTALEAFFSKDDALAPAVRIVQEYDDNIGLESDDLREGSWKSLVIPTLALDFPGRQTSCFVEYTPAFIYYYTGADRLDVDQDAAVKFSHFFTPRYWVHLNDIFLRKETPQDIRRPVVPQERNADYNFNLVEARFGNQLTKQITWGLEYDNEWFYYDTSIMRRFFNRVSNVGEATFRYELNPSLRLSGSYSLRFSDYEDDASDYYSHLLRIGVNYRLAKRLTLQVWGGYQARDYDSGQNLTGPYAEFDCEAMVSSELYLEAGYWHKIEDTYEITHRGVWEHGVKGTVHYRLLPKVKLTATYLGIFSYYPSSLDVAGEAVSADETFWKLEAEAAFEILADIVIKPGYRHTENSSDFPDASYFRNQTYLEFAVTF